MSACLTPAAQLRASRSVAAPHRSRPRDDRRPRRGAPSPRRSSWSSRPRRLLLWLLLTGLLAPSLASAGTDDEAAALAAARSALQRRQFAQGKAALEALLRRPGLDAEVADEARAELLRLTQRFTVHTQRVGLLAPLSGKYRALGEGLRRGAELALTARGGPTVVVEDTAGTPEGAVAAVDKLVLQQGVVALIGPLGDHESRAAALRASELDVPILVLGAAEDLPGLSPWVFRHRISAEDQARAAASHALLDLGLRRFAILFPDDEYGRAQMNAFWDEVQRGGGEVRGAEAYPAGGGDPDPAIRRLIGGYPAGAARPDDFEIKGKGKQIAYQPLVDFEAVFLPDSPQRARTVLSQLSFYDVRLNTGGSHAVGHAAHAPVQVLGPGSWNGEVIARGAEPVVQNAHFPGALVVSSPQPVVQAFVQLFRERHGRLPSELEAQAYDAGGWLWVAWRQAARQGRPAVQAALASLGGFIGVTGEVQVLPDGGTRTAQAILTVRGKDVVPLLFTADRARGPVQDRAPFAPAIELRR